MALPKIHRLRRRQDFNAVYRSRLRKETPHLKLLALRSRQPKSAPAADRPAPEQATRVGISISKKVSKRAVVRNRIKRQLKAAMRELLPSLANAWMLVIEVRPKAVECGYQEFLQELKQLLEDAEVFDGHSGRRLL